MDYFAQALKLCSITLAMKTLYEAIKSSSIAYLTINSIPLEVQLPPYLDFLLHPGEDEDQRPYEDDDDQKEMWGKEMSVGWRLPTLAPWKSILLLDGPGAAGPGLGGVDPNEYLEGPHLTQEDQKLAEGLFRFLDEVKVTFSSVQPGIPLLLTTEAYYRLEDMSNLLDWDLETQVFPVVRWLVHHRRAKVVDIVREGLKSVFSLPPKFDQP
jgi:nitrogen permease regulator 3-like protein